jgi:hypothetical protein
VELVSQITAASARLIAMIGEFDAAEGWRDWGMRSTAHWLSWKTGIGIGAGREQVRVARALRGLPSTATAFVAGRLSYAKVRALTRFVVAETDAEFAAMAESATGAQIERLGAKIPAPQGVRRRQPGTRTFPRKRLGPAPTSRSSASPRSITGSTTSNA